MSSMKTTPQRIPRLSRSGKALTSAERWQAVIKRDATISNFVYGVLTTKIYCRPSCPARLARRANVEFYDTPSQAEAAGLRPCKRCKPQCDLMAAANSQATMVSKACAVIQDTLGAGVKPKLQDLAAGAGLTTSHFHRVFKKQMGVTPGQYVSGIMEGTGVRGCSSDSSTPDNVSTFDMPWLNFVDESRMTRVMDADESLALSGTCEPPVILDGWSEWNDFDELLAAEQGERSLESVFIDPRIISM